MSIDTKILDMLKAHYDGVYMLSKRENCDEIVTHLIGDYMTLEKMHKDAEARATERESGWQPIETAPRDGTLIWLNEFGTLEPDMIPMAGRYRRTELRPEGIWVDWHGRGNYRPTHWMKISAKIEDDAPPNPTTGE